MTEVTSPQLSFPFAVESELPLVFREMRATDVAFIVDSWVLSLEPPYWMPKKAYRSNMRRSVAATIDRSRVVVLASKDHDSAIMGWACGDDGVVHHAYVRVWLRQGEEARKWVDALVQKAMGK